MSAAFEAFKQKVTPPLDQAMVQFRLDFPRVSFSRCLEDNHFNYTAMIADQPGHLPDVLELDVHNWARNESELEIEADMIWGDGCGHLEATFLSELMSATDTSLETLAARTLGLLDAMRTGLLRGKPEGR